jgi:hypothetical protein
MLLAGLGLPAAMAALMLKRSVLARSLRLGGRPPRLLGCGSSSAIWRGDRRPPMPCARGQLHPGLPGTAPHPQRPPRSPGSSTTGACCSRSWAWSAAHPRDSAKPSVGRAAPNGARTGAHRGRPAAKAHGPRAGGDAHGRRRIEVAARSPLMRETAARAGNPCWPPAQSKGAGRSAMGGQAWRA